MESDTTCDELVAQNTLILYQKSKRKSSNRFSKRYNLESCNSDSNTKQSTYASYKNSSLESNLSTDEHTQHFVDTSLDEQSSLEPRRPLKKRSRKDYVLRIQENLDGYYKERIQPVVDVLRKYGRKKIKIKIDNEPYMGVSYSDGRIVLDYSLLLSKNYSKMLFILAHEWGHRFLRHMVGLSGELSKQQEQEKQADFFSAYIISKYFKDTFNIDALRQYMCGFLIEDKSLTHLVGPLRFEYFLKAFLFSEQNMSNFTPRQIRHYLQKMLSVEENILQIASQKYNESFRILFENIPKSIARISDDRLIRLSPKILKYTHDVIANILAHEVGHCVLGHLEPDHASGTKRRRMDEKEADAFAAYIMSKYFPELECLDGFNRALCQSKHSLKSKYHLTGDERFNFYRNSYQFSKDFLQRLTSEKVLEILPKLAEGRVCFDTGNILPRFSLFCRVRGSESEKLFRKKSLTI